MNKVIFTVGNIGSGKSRWVKQQDFKNVVCKDHAREVLGESVNKEYFWSVRTEQLIHTITLGIFEALLYAKTKLIVLDETLMTKQSRSPFLKLVKQYDYQCEALVFANKGLTWHIKNRMKYPRDLSCNEWEKIWQEKHNNFQYPDYVEGFDVIKDHT